MLCIDLKKKRKIGILEQMEILLLLKVEVRKAK